MHQHVRHNQVEGLVFEIGALGHLLREVNGIVHRYGPGMAIAQAGRGDIDGVHFGIGKVDAVSTGAVPHGAAHVQNPRRFEIGEVCLHPADERMASIIQVGAQAPHGIQPVGAIKLGAGEDIISHTLRMVVTRLAVIVQCRGVAGYLNVRIQAQRSSFASGRLCFVD